jgi:hypothetical protein
MLVSDGVVVVDVVEGPVYVVVVVDVVDVDVVVKSLDAHFPFPPVPQVPEQHGSVMP